MPKDNDDKKEPLTNVDTIKISTVETRSNPNTPAKETKSIEIRMNLQLFGKKEDE